MPFGAGEFTGARRCGDAAGRGAPTPFDALRAALPEPNAEAAFQFDGDTDDGVPEKGRLRIVAEPGTFEDAPAWFVIEETDTPPLPGPGTPATHERRTTWLSRDLRVLRADAVETSEGVKVEISATSTGTKVTKTIDGGKPDTTTFVHGTTGGLTLAGAILYFRMCPAEATALPDPVPYPVVTRVDPDGGLTGTAMTGDAYQVFLTLRGKDRMPVLIERFLGWHNMGTTTARTR